MPRPARPPAKPIEVTIDHIGSAGDGSAQTQDGATLHIARTLPGERALVRPEPDGKRATLLEILQPSPDRVAPPCPHFTQLCGGCALQHWADAPYAAWKRNLVIAALTRAGFENPPAASPVAPMIRTPPHARRRMDFAAERVEGGVRLGLHQANSKQIVDFTQCTVLHPTLAALIAPLRQTLRTLAALRHRGSILANLLADGPDLLIRTDGPLEATDRAKLATLANTNNIRRIAWALNDGPPETASMQAAPHVIFGTTRVEPPPGAFLQASTEGQTAIVAAVLAAIPPKITNRSRAVELYAGCGTISFPLAAHLRVQAYEGEAEAAASVRRAQTNTRVEITQRDLARQPLSTKELTGASLIVLDPPYAGAAPQMPAIAASAAPRVAYVSCNPGALARDAAVLHQAGYQLLAATPIDQFLWSAQVECTAVFERK
jgi:23S rRNA (uracil1939-C5)-methyltransferase